MGGYSKEGVVNGREGHSSKGVVNWWKMAIKVHVANNTRLEPGTKAVELGRYDDEYKLYENKRIYKSLNIKEQLSQ